VPEGVAHELHSLARLGEVVAEQRDDLLTQLLRLGGLRGGVVRVGAAGAGGEAWGRSHGRRHLCGTAGDLQRAGHTRLGVCHQLLRERHQGERVAVGGVLKP